MEQFELNRTKDKSKIDAKPIKDGSAYLAVDEQSQSGDLYIDYGEKRYNVSGNVGYKKITTKGFKITNWSGEHGESGIYMLFVPRETNKTDLTEEGKKVVEKLNNLNNKIQSNKLDVYYTIMNDMNGDSFGKITRIDANTFTGVGLVALYVDKLYTNSNYSEYKSERYYDENEENILSTTKAGSVWSIYPDLGWTIATRDAGTVGWEKQACLFINDYPELGTFDWFQDSYALGKDNLAQGKVSFAQGQGNKAYGKYSAVFGNNNKAGYADAVFGRGNDASGAQVSFVAGQENTITDLGFYHAVFGEGNKVSGGAHKLVAGKFNQDKDTNILEIGYGAGDSDRRNVFEVDKSGRPAINGTYMKGQTLFDTLSMTSEQSKDYVKKNLLSMDWTIISDNNQNTFLSDEDKDTILVTSSDSNIIIQLNSDYTNQQIQLQGWVDSGRVDRIIIYSSKDDTIGTTYMWDENDASLLINNYLNCIDRIEIQNANEMSFHFIAKIPLMPENIFDISKNLGVFNQSNTQFGPRFRVNLNDSFKEEDNNWYVLVATFYNNTTFSPTSIATWYTNKENNLETSGPVYQLSNITFEANQDYICYLPIYITDSLKRKNNSTNSTEFLVTSYGFYFQNDNQTYNYNLTNVNLSLFKAHSITMDDNLPNYNYEIISYSTPYFITSNEYMSGNFYNYNFNYNPKCFVMESNKHLYLFPTVQVTATTYYPGNIWISDCTERNVLENIKKNTTTLDDQRIMIDQLNQDTSQQLARIKNLEENNKKIKIQTQSIKQSDTIYCLQGTSGYTKCVILAYDVSDATTYDNLAQAKITVNNKLSNANVYQLNILGTLSSSLTLTKIQVTYLEVK